MYSRLYVQIQLTKVRFSAEFLSGLQLTLKIIVFQFWIQKFQVSFTPHHHIDSRQSLGQTSTKDGIEAAGRFQSYLDKTLFPFIDLRLCCFLIGMAMKIFHGNSIGLIELPRVSMVFHHENPHKHCLLRSVGKQTQPQESISK